MKKNIFYYKNYNEMVQQKGIQNVKEEVNEAVKNKFGFDSHILLENKQTNSDNLIYKFKKVI